MTRAKVLALAAVFGLALAVLLIPWLISRAHFNSAAVAQYISTYAEQQLGYHVEIGGVRLTLLNDLAVNNIHIFDVDGTPMLSCEELTISLSWWDLIKQPSPEHIRKLVLIRPQLAARKLADGRYNIQAFIEQQQRSDTPPTKFNALVVVKQGTIAVADLPIPVKLEQVDAQLDFARFPYLKLQVQARNQDAQWAASGQIQTEKQNGYLHIDIEHDDLARYTPLLEGIPTFAVAGGTASLSVDVDGDFMHHPHFSGQLSVTDAAATFRPLQGSLTGINGKMTFDNQGIFFHDTAGALNGQQFMLTGGIRYDGMEPLLNLQVKSDRFRPEAGLPGLDLPLSGPARLDIAVNGPVSDMTIGGVVALNDGRLFNYSVSDLEAQFSYCRDTLQLTSAKTKVWGGSVSASGAIQLKPDLSYRLFVQSDGVNVAALPVPIQAQDLRGHVSATAYVTGQGSDLQQLSVWGQLQSSDLCYRQLQSSALRTAFSYRQGEFTLDYLQVSLGQGSLFASGTMTADHALHFTANGRNLPLDTVSLLTDKVTIQGVAGLRATIDGTLEQPTVQASLVSARGQIMKQPYNSLRGNVRLEGPVLTIQQLDLKSGSAQNHVSGKIELCSDPVLNLKISSSQARAEHLLQLAGVDQPLTGNVDQEAELTGPLSQLEVRGKVLLTDGSYRGHLINRAAMDYELQSGVVTLSNGVVHSPEGQLLVTGTIGLNKQLGLKFTVTGLELEQWVKQPRFAVNGKIGAVGTVTGDVNDPVIKSKVSSDYLICNQQTFSGLTGNVDYDHGIVSLTDMNLQNAQERYQADLMMGMDRNGILQGRVQLSKVQLASIMNAAGMANKQIRGLINGTAQLSGTVDNPMVYSQLQLTDGYPLDRMDVEASLKDHIVTLVKLEATQGKGLLAARGSVDLNGNAALEVGGRDLDVGIIQAFVPLEQRVQGRISFATQVTGNIKHPRAATSVQIDKAMYGETDVDAVYGMLIVENNQIQLNQFMITKKSADPNDKTPYKASVYGTIPINALTKQGREVLTDQDSMNVKIKLDKSDLSILPLLTKEVSWGSGKTDGEITITGTARHPKFNGFIAVPNGSLKFKELAEPLQDIQARVNFNGDTINVEQVTAQIGKGTVQIVGNIQMDGLALGKVDLKLDLNNLNLHSKLYNGPLEGHLKLETIKGRPLLSGLVSIDNATINVPVPLPESKPISYDVRLDLTVGADHMVRFYNQQFFDIRTQGQLRVLGTLEHPEVRGQVKATRGTFNYLRTAFTINEAEADFREIGSIIPTVKVDSQTRFGKYLVHLAVTGPLNGLDFSLTSDPPLSQQDIIMMLTFHDRAAGSQSKQDTMQFNSDDFRSLLSTGLQFRYMGNMEGTFQRALGVDEFKIVSSMVNTEGLAAREAYRVQITKYLTDNLSVSYGQQLNSVGSNTYGFRYDITRRISLEGSSDETRQTQISLQMRVPF